MSDYYNVFKSRMTADGSNYKDQLENLSKRNFERYLAESPNTESVSINGVEFQASVLTNKQDEFRLSKLLLTNLDIPIAVGDLVEWEDFEESDSKNIWIVWKIEQNPMKDYNHSYISRCNHYLKWIDTDGIKREQYVYEFSSKETIIRATFKSRVEQIIASEPNKYMEIIMPKTSKIEREQRFIIDGEAWYAIELDSSSAPGITYVTLGEDKKDIFDDSLISKGDAEDIADINELNKNSIDVVAAFPIVSEGVDFTIYPTYYREGSYEPDAVFNFKVNGEYVMDGDSKFEGAFFTNQYSEDSTVIVELAENNEICKTVQVTVEQNTDPTTILTISGNASIKWNKTAEYTVQKTVDGVAEEIVDDITYTISDETLASIEIDDNNCYVKANSQRKVGTITLTATLEELSAEKIIEIVSLW